MGLMKGKKGIVMGIANDRSIATAVARRLYQEGAELGFSFLPDTGERKRNEERLRQVTDGLKPTLIHPCDVASDAHVADFFAAVQEKMGPIDFVVHSIAFAPTDDIKKRTIDVSREGFAQAMDISVYSFLNVCRQAATNMPEGGSICGMTYYGGEKVMPGYNLMGVCKAALDAAIKYAAFELGNDFIRVNGISAGPVRTLAASAVGDFKKMLNMYQDVSPLRRNIEGEDVAQACTYLLSDMSKMVTGEILHVDAGFNIMGGMMLQPES
ncbi:MAG: enoyl-ACP reductase FabI [Oligoflexus sp.]